MDFARLEPPLITLTTDFGLSDMYVGVMRGILFGIAPHARVIDLTHAIAPQNVREASARLDSNVDYFPPGTLHVVVVDPGVGSERSVCVVQTGRYLFLAPDNGVLTLSLRQRPVRRAVRLTEAAKPYCRPTISATFHGRDVFAPVAAHLAMGLPLEALGERVAPDALVRFPVAGPQAETDADGLPALRLTVLYADHFGNLITDLTPQEWTVWRQTYLPAATEEEASTGVQIRVGATQWSGIARTFSDVAPGQSVAYWGSDGRLEIGVRDGNAARISGLSPGDSVYLTGTV